MHTAATALAAITVRHRNTGDDSRGGIVTSIYPRFYDCRVGRRRFGRALLDFHGKPRALGTLRCAWYNCTERCDHSGPRILVSQPPTGAATRGALCTCVNPRFASSHSVSHSLAVALTRGPLATRGSLSRSISLSLSLSPSIACQLLYAPVIQHDDGGCVYPSLSPRSLFFVPVTLSLSLSPCFSSSLSRASSPCRSRPHFLPFSVFHVILSLLETFYLLLSSSTMVRGGCWLGRGRGESLSRCFFPRQQREAGGVHAAFDSI